MTASAAQIGARIRERRQMLGLSLEDVAKVMGGLTYQTIAKYECGQLSIPPLTIARLGIALGLSVAYITREEPDEPPISLAAIRAARDIDSLSVGRRQTLIQFIAKLAKEEQRT